MLADRFGQRLAHLADHQVDHLVLGGVDARSAAAVSASARARALRRHSRCAARARENAAATVSRSAAGALTTTSDWFCGERLSIVWVLMTRRTLAL